MAIILDIGFHRLFQPVCVKGQDEEKRSFLPLQFVNKGIDATDLANNFHHKNVTNKIPPYFKDKSTLIISNSYISHVASKTFKYNRLLQDLGIEDVNAKPPDCSRKSFPFKYGPSGHAITGDLIITENKSLLKVLSKGPKYREPRSINWNYNLKTLMGAVGDFAIKW